MGNFGFSFSWKRALGITAAKQKFTRVTGIPTSVNGVERKVGRSDNERTGWLWFIFLMVQFLLLSVAEKLQAGDELEMTLKMNWVIYSWLGFTVVQCITDYSRKIPSETEILNIRK